MSLSDKGPRAQFLLFSFQMQNNHKMVWSQVWRKAISQWIHQDVYENKSNKIERKSRWVMRRSNYIVCAGKNFIKLTGGENQQNTIFPHLLQIVWCEPIYDWLWSLWRVVSWRLCEYFWKGIKIHQKILLQGVSKSQPSIAHSIQIEI